MQGKREETRVCVLHGGLLELRPDGLHCKECARLGQQGNIIIAACPLPACGIGLVDPVREIDGHPAIKIGWRYMNEALRDGDHVLHVSAAWGGRTVRSEPEIREGEVLDLFCPWCGASLPTVAYCTCNAKMVGIKSLYVRDGSSGMIQVCSRRGCPEHKKVSVEEVMAMRGLEWMMRGGNRADDEEIGGLSQRDRRGIRVPPVAPRR